MGGRDRAEEDEQIPPPLAHASLVGAPPPPARGKLMRVTAHPTRSGSPPFAVSAPVLPACLRHVPQARRQGGAPLPRPPKRAYVAQLVACATRAPCKLCAASLALRRASFRASHAPPALVRPGACVALNAPPAVRAYAAPPAALRRAPQAVPQVSRHQTRRPSRLQMPTHQQCPVACQEGQVRQLRAAGHAGSGFGVSCSWGAGESPLVWPSAGAGWEGSGRM